MQALSTPQLAALIVAQFSARGLTLACAESFTGGAICAALTAVPGASAVLKGGVVAYSMPVKRALLVVPAELFETCGAVSEPVAAAMSAGALAVLGADFALASSGVAGPGELCGDGTLEPRKPAGLAYISVQQRGGRECVRRHQLAGSRGEVIAEGVRLGLLLLAQQAGIRA